MKVLKRVAIIFGVIFALLAAAALIVPLVVDVDKYRPQIVSAVNEKLNGKFELGKLSLSLWGQIRVEVAGLGVKDAAGRPVLSVKDAFFHLPFSSVFSGSPSLILKMTRPEVFVVKDKTGKLNVMNLVKAEGQAAAQPPAGAPPAAEGSKNVSLPAIAVNSRFTVELDHALVSYLDEATASKADIQDLNVALRDISLSRTTDLEIWADLNTRFGKTFSMHGPFRISGKLKPEVAGGKLERVSLGAKADFDQVEIVIPELFEKRAGLAAHADLAMSASQKEMVIEALDAKFFNAELKSHGKISNFQPQGAAGAASPVVEFVAKSNEIALKPWVELVPMLKQYELGGTASLDAEAHGPSDKLGYQANFKVAALTAKAPMLKAQPRIDATAKVVTDQLENLTLTMKAPGNDLRVEGKVISFTHPQATFEVVSKEGMDLDQLIDFPPPGAKKAAAKEGGAPAASPVPGAPGGAKPVQADLDALVDPLRQNKIAAATDAKIKLNIPLLKAYNVRMTDITGNLGMHELAATLNSFKMKLWSGAVTADGAVQMKPERPTYHFSTKVDGLDLKQAVASQFQLFKDTLLGKASFQMAADGKSFNPVQATDNLKAKGNFKVAQATFQTVDIGKAVTDALNKSIDRIAEKIPSIKGKKINAPQEREGGYQLISSDFALANGKFSATNLVGKANPNQGFDFKGDTHVTLKDLAVKASLEISDTYNLTHAKDISVDEVGVKVEHILAEGNNPVRFPIHVNCTLTAPCYSYTEVPEHLVKVAVNNLAGAAKGKLKGEIQKKLESVIPKSAPPKVQEQIEDIGKKLFGR